MSNPRWVQIALAEQGQAEIAGGGHNPRIVEYHATTGFRAKDDETPWCASFLGWCLEQAGIKSTASAAARSYEQWGVSLAQPVVGAVVTFTRSGGGHVGFYMGERDGKWLILGGNQSNRVSIALYDPARMTSIRWPAGVPLPNAVAPLRKSGVIQGSVLAGAASVAQVGAALLDQREAVETAQSYIGQGTTLGLIFGVLALAGIAYVIFSRVQGKKASAE
jgi:uncharacterized protein (TIGR02594 family)